MNESTPEKMTLEQVESDLTNLLKKHFKENIMGVSVGMGTKWKEIDFESIDLMDMRFFVERKYNLKGSDLGKDLDNTFGSMVRHYHRVVNSGLYHK
jgi:hypothetical protein